MSQVGQSNPTIAHAEYLESDEKKKGLVGKLLVGLMLGMLLAGTLAGCVAPSKISEEEKIKKTPVENPYFTQTPKVTSIETSPQSLVHYCEKLGLSEEVTKEIKEKLGIELNENNRQLIDLLAEVKEKDYVPGGIKDLVTFTYGEKKKAEIVGKILEGAMDDKKLDEKEKIAIEYLLSLPESVQKEYLGKYKFNHELVEYLNIIAQIKDEKFRVYVSKTQFGFADGKLDEKEKEFLESRDKDVNEIVEHYLKELSEKNPELTKEIRKLPEFNRTSITTAEALEDILALAKQSEPYEKFEDRFDPSKITPAREVYEAFELMLKGGTPDPKDFKYPVPAYNTELECLWWLAEENEFKNYDTLAQAIAMTHGIWVTMGDNEVISAVKKDINDLLRFGRETSELQEALELNYNLEKYPLEAKVAWAWRGGLSPTHGTYCFVGPSDQCKYPHLTKKFDLKGYSWNSVKIKILENMRKHVLTNLTFNVESADKFIGLLEEYFYFSGGNMHWEYIPSWDTLIEVENERVPARNYGNVNFLFERYRTTGKGIGVCMEETLLVDSISRSVGISTLPLSVYWKKQMGNREWYDGHQHIIYFDGSNLWKGYYKQIYLDTQDALILNSSVDAYVLIPPINQREYMEHTEIPSNVNVLYPYISKEIDSNMYALIFSDIDELSKLENGIKTTIIKKLILYN